MDFIVDLPPSDGCTILLVITDRLSKGAILIPVPPDKFDALGTAELFIRYCDRNAYVETRGRS